MLTSVFFNTLVKLFEQVDDIQYRLKLPKSTSIRLVTQVESSRGLLNLQRICELDQTDAYESLVLVHDGIILGGDDFAADIGRFLEGSSLTQSTRGENIEREGDREPGYPFSVLHLRHHPIFLKAQQGQKVLASCSMPARYNYC